MACGVVAAMLFVAMVYAPESMPRGDIAEGMARFGAIVSLLILGTAVGATGAVLGTVGLLKRREGWLASSGIVINLLAVGSGYLVLLVY